MAEKKNKEKEKKNEDQQGKKATERKRKTSPEAPFYLLTFLISLFFLFLPCLLFGLILRRGLALRTMRTLLTPLPSTSGSCGLKFRASSRHSSTRRRRTLTRSGPTTPLLSSCSSRTILPLSSRCLPRRCRSLLCPLPPPPRLPPLAP